ncbi:uncharacterized protein BJ171DRAFT_511585 [Polychytrium aggregatum]|uniref:uncharacterized protein n=1 Tax=Polychytrium aggregatum TaxID=110093 RepID=UPI0022FE4909|nr:uncharacterized protein BJ171DRAFT_511585 [Polychytrium aggregatum]KAI9203023.1 hypothetical protein BJ171DRAFT_511585 [Polychytrium aggregatum]
MSSSLSASAISNPTSSSVHAKIEMDCLDDLTYLQDQIRNAIKAIFSEIRARQDGPFALGDEAMEKFTEKYIKRLFKMAGPNIKINGVEFEEAIQKKVVYEEFDEGLSRKCQELAHKVEMKRLAIAELKRKCLPEIETLSDSILEQRLALIRSFSARPNAQPLVPAHSALDDFVDSHVTEQYVASLDMVAAVSKDIEPVVQKLRRARQVLESWNIPQSSVERTPSRRSTMGASTTPSATPRRSRSGFMRRLEATAQYNPY